MLVVELKASISIMGFKMEQTDDTPFYAEDSWCVKSTWANILSLGGAIFSTEAIVLLSLLVVFSFSVSI